MNIGLVYLNRSKTIHMGLAYISAVLKAHNHKVTLFDTAFMSDAEIVFALEDSGINLLMFSVHSIALHHAKELSRRVKYVYPSMRILWGGWHVLIDPEGCIANPSVDMICIGEGESATLELVENPDRTDIKNIWFKDKDGGIIINDMRPPEDIDRLPFPDRDIFNRVCLEDQNGLFHFTTLRGCPYRCSFCCNYKILDLYKDINCKYIRYRDIDKVIEEMIVCILKYSPREFFFTDEMFLTDKKRIEEFCRKYKESMIDIPFGFMARPERITEELLLLLKDAGCKRIHIGIESGNEDYRRKYLNRHMTNETIINAFDLCRRHGILTASFNMIGLPFETPETIRDTFELNRRCDPDIFQVTILYPFIGTAIREIYRENNMIDFREEHQNRSNNYYDSCITRDIGVSLTYLRQMRNHMNIYFNYSHVLGEIAKYIPGFLCDFYYHAVQRSMKFYKDFMGLNMKGYKNM